MIVEARRDLVSLRGSLTDNEWSTIQAAAKLLLEEHPKGIIIDCSGLTEVTEAGAKTFQEAINYIQKHDAKMIVVGLPASALEVMRGVRAVVSQLPVARSVEEARASLGLEDLASQLTPSSMHVVAVLLVGDRRRAMYIACSAADKRRDEIHIIDLVKVPRSIPLATPLPEEEAAARRRLDDAERTTKQFRVKSVRHVERVRSIAEGVQRVMSRLNPSTFIVCVSHVTDETSEIVNQVMPGLLSNPPCEVVYVRRPDDWED